MPSETKPSVPYFLKPQTCLTWGVSRKYLRRKLFRHTSLMSFMSP